MVIKYGCDVSVLYRFISKIEFISVLYRFQIDLVWALLMNMGSVISVLYRFISKNRVYFGIVSVSDRFGLGTVDEYGFRNLVFISIYKEKSSLFRYCIGDDY